MSDSDQNKTNPAAEHVIEILMADSRPDGGCDSPASGDADPSEVGTYCERPSGREGRSSQYLRRGPGRPRKEAPSPVLKKHHPKKSKPKRGNVVTSDSGATPSTASSDSLACGGASLDDAASASTEVSLESKCGMGINIDLPTVKVKTEPLTSFIVGSTIGSQSASLSGSKEASASAAELKTEPSFSHAVGTDTANESSGQIYSRTDSVPTQKPASEESAVLDETRSRVPMSLMEADAYSFHTVSGTMDRVCAFCSRGEKSLLGQGDLTRNDPTPGFNPFRKQVASRCSKRISSESVDDQVLTGGVGGKRGQTSIVTPTLLRGGKNRGMVGKQQQCEKAPCFTQSSKASGAGVSRGNTEEEPGNSPHTLPMVDELSLVGYPEDTDLNQVFEKTGHTTAHHCCAAWSEGVIQMEDYSLRFVDKAVFAGISQKCSYCLRYGATIKCKDARCSKKYHYPCASGSGCFQDIKTLSLLCPDHTDQAVAIANQEAFCVVCDSPGNISDQLFCTSCGQHYHGNCLDPTVEVNPVVRAGWQCPDCKICQTCRQPGDDNKMLVCDTCDKGYHTFCLRPVMTTIPKNGWKCKNCRVCGDCGSHTPGSRPNCRWHLNYSVCDGCYQQRNKGQSCPVCSKAYQQPSTTQDKLMWPCSQCKRFVHAECDETIEVNRSGSPDIDYVCLACKTKDNTNEASNVDYGSLTDSLSSMVDESSLQDIENFGIFKRLKESDGGMHRGSGDMDDFDGTDLLHGGGSQDSLQLRVGLRGDDDSISSMDIDLTALDKDVQQLGGCDDTYKTCYSRCSVNDPSEASTISASKPNTTGVGEGGMARRPTHGPGRGKPMFDDDYGKRGRNKNRSVGIGKKKRTTGMGAVSSAPAANPTGKRGPKAKPKQIGTNGCSAMQTGSVDSQGGSKGDDDHTATVVLCSSKDQYTLKQDMCLSCGSYGRGEEGKLIACVQCGQCYHPYCVNIKISTAMLQKGWRCLDCTVCEGCGKPHDESRLILCDECDISYHIYCLDPPLDSVPQGAWKCKWCIVCVMCGSTTPGTLSQWQNNYSQCGPCASLAVCPACNNHYTEEDLIIQCSNCDRWLHASCDGLKNEDETDKAIDYGYHCLLCRPVTGVTGPLPPEKIEEPVPPEPVTPALPPKEPDLPKVLKTFFYDGVCLSEAGIAHIRALSNKFVEQKKPRWRRPPSHPGLISMMSMSSERSEDDVDMDTKGFASTDPLDGDDCKTDLSHPTDDWDMTSPTLDRHGSDSTSIQPTSGGPPEKIKRQRNRVGMGVGGFIPRYKARGGSVVRSRSIQYPDQDEFDADGKKIKKRGPQKKIIKKPFLDGSYSVLLQEAFFGRGLLETSKTEQLKEFDSPIPDNDHPLIASTISLSTLTVPITSSSSSTAVRKASSQDPFDVTSPMLEHASSAMASFDKNSSGVGSWGSNRVADRMKQSKDGSLMAAGIGGSFGSHTAGNSQPQHDDESDKDQNIDYALDVLPEEPLEDDLLIGLPWDDMTANSSGEHSDLPSGSRVGSHGGVGGTGISGLEAMLNPNIDDLAQLDSKTLDDILMNTGLPGTEHMPGGGTGHDTSPMSLPGSSFMPHGMLHVGHGSGGGDTHGDMDRFGPKAGIQSHRGPVSGGVVGVSVGMYAGGQDTQHSCSTSPLNSSMSGDDFRSLGFPSADGKSWHHHHQSTATGAQFVMRHPSPGDLQPGMMLMGSDTSSLGPGGAGDDLDGGEHLSYNQRNVKKWEKDEPLGLMATITPVLYCNMEHPDLMRQYPDWNERSKQISKLWRKVPSEQRAPYLTKARDNRANSRLQKAQKLNQEMKRRQKDPSISSATCGSNSNSNSVPPTSLSQTPPNIQQEPSLDAPEMAHTSQMSSNDEQRAGSSTNDSPFAVQPEKSHATIQQAQSPSTTVAHIVATSGTTAGAGYMQLQQQQIQQHLHQHQLHQQQQLRAEAVFKQPHPPMIPSAGYDHFGMGGRGMEGGHGGVAGGGQTSAGVGGNAGSSPIDSYARPQGAGAVDSYVRGGAFRPGPPGRQPEGTIGSPLGLPMGFRPGHPGHFQRPFGPSEMERFSSPRQSSGGPGPSGVGAQSPEQQQFVSSPSGGMSPQQLHMHHSQQLQHQQQGESSPLLSPRSQQQQQLRGMIGELAMKQPQHVLQRSLSDPYAVGTGSSHMRSNIDTYNQTMMTAGPRSSDDPYSQQPMTPRLANDPYSQQPMTPRPAGSDQYGQSQLMARPSDPYAQQPMTPRPSDPYSPMAPRSTPSDVYSQMAPRANVGDPYAQQPMTPRTQMGADPYAQQAMTPRPQMTSDPYGQMPMTPRQIISTCGEQFGQSPAPPTPQPTTGETYSGGGSGTGGSQSGGSRPGSTDSFAQGRGASGEMYVRPGSATGDLTGSMMSRPSPQQQQQMQQQQPPGQGHSALNDGDLFGGPSSSSDNRTTAITMSKQKHVEQSSSVPMPRERGNSHPPLYEYNYRLWQYGPQSEVVEEAGISSGARMETGEQFKHDIHPQQVRELLAKQSKHRQSKKKQEENKRLQQEPSLPSSSSTTVDTGVTIPTSTGGDASLSSSNSITGSHRQWPQGADSTANQTASLGFAAYERGNMAGQRPLGTDYSGAPGGGAANLPGDGERWPKEQMIRPPYPGGQTRPGEPGDHFISGGGDIISAGGGQMLRAGVGFPMMMRGGMRPPPGGSGPYPPGMMYPPAMGEAGGQFSMTQQQLQIQSESEAGPYVDMAQMRAMFQDRSRAPAGPPGTGGSLVDMGATRAPAGVLAQRSADSEPMGFLPQSPRLMHPAAGAVGPVRGVGRRGGGTHAMYDTGIAGTFRGGLPQGPGGQIMQMPPQMRLPPQQMMMTGVGWPSQRGGPPMHPQNFPRGATASASMFPYASGGGEGMTRSPYVGGVPSPSKMDLTGGHSLVEGHGTQFHVGPAGTVLSGGSTPGDIHRPQGVIGVPEMGGPGSSGVGVSAGQHVMVDKTDDQFEDLLGTTDDGFNLLEYADPDLDCALTEAHDKSIFDVHLGILNSSPPANSSVSSATVQQKQHPAPASGQQQVAVVPEPASAAGGLTLPQASIGRDSVSAIAKQVVGEQAITGEQSVAKGGESLPQLASAPGIDKQISSVDSESDTTPKKDVDESTVSKKKIEGSQDNERVTPTAGVGSESGGATRLTPPLTDFQAKFLEFSQARKKPTSGPGTVSSSVAAGTTSATGTGSIDDAVDKPHVQPKDSSKKGKILEIEKKPNVNDLPRPDATLDASSGTACAEHVKTLDVTDDGQVATVAAPRCSSSQVINIQEAAVDSVQMTIPNEKESETKEECLADNEITKTNVLPLQVDGCDDHDEEKDEYYYEHCIDDFSGPICEPFCVYTYGLSQFDRPVSVYYHSLDDADDEELVGIWETSRIVQFDGPADDKEDAKKSTAGEISGLSVSAACQIVENRAESLKEGELQNEAMDVIADTGVSEQVETTPETPKDVSVDAPPVALYMSAGNVVKSDMISASPIMPQVQAPVVYERPVVPDLNKGSDGVVVHEISASIMQTGDTHASPTSEHVASILESDVPHVSLSSTSQEELSLNQEPQSGASHPCKEVKDSVFVSEVSSLTQESKLFSVNSGIDNEYTEAKSLVGKQVPDNQCRTNELIDTSNIETGATLPQGSETITPSMNMELIPKVGLTSDLAAADANCSNSLDKTITRQDIKVVSIINSKSSNVHHNSNVNFHSTVLSQGDGHQEIQKALEEKSEPQVECEQTTQLVSSSAKEESGPDVHEKSLQQQLTLNENQAMANDISSIQSAVVHQHSVIEAESSLTGSTKMPAILEQKSELMHYQGEDAPNTSGPAPPPSIVTQPPEVQQHHDQSAHPGHAVSGEGPNASMAGINHVQGQLPIGPSLQTLDANSVSLQTVQGQLQQQQMMHQQQLQHRFRMQQEGVRQSMMVRMLGHPPGQQMMPNQLSQHMMPEQAQLQQLMTGQLGPQSISGQAPQQMMLGESPQQMLPIPSQQQVTTNHSQQQMMPGQFSQQALPAQSLQQLISGQSPQQIISGHSPQQMVRGQSPQQMVVQTTQSLIPGQTSQQIVSGQVSSQVIAGQSPQHMMSGHSPQQIMMGQSSQQMMPGQLPQQMMPGQSPQQMMSGQSPQQMMPGQSPNPMMTGQSPHQMMPGQSQHPMMLAQSQNQMMPGQSPRQTMPYDLMQQQQFMQQQQQHQHHLMQQQQQQQQQWQLQHQQIHPQQQQQMMQQMQQRFNMEAGGLPVRMYGMQRVSGPPPPYPATHQSGGATDIPHMRQHWMQHAAQMHYRHPTSQAGPASMYSPQFGAASEHDFGADGGGTYPSSSSQHPYGVDRAHAISHLSIQNTQSTGGEGQDHASGQNGAVLPAADQQKCLTDVPAMLSSTGQLVAHSPKSAPSPMSRPGSVSGGHSPHPAAVTSQSPHPSINAMSSSSPAAASSSPHHHVMPSPRSRSGTPQLMSPSAGNGGHTGLSQPGTPAAQRGTPVLQSPMTSEPEMRAVHGTPTDGCRGIAPTQAGAGGGDQAVVEQQVGIAKEGMIQMPVGQQTMSHQTMTLPDGSATQSESTILHQQQQMQLQQMQHQQLLLQQHQQQQFQQQQFQQQQLGQPRGGIVYGNQLRGSQSHFMSPRDPTGQRFLTSGPVPGGEASMMRYPPHIMLSESGGPSVSQISQTVAGNGMHSSSAIGALLNQQRPLPPHAALMMQQMRAGGMGGVYGGSGMQSQMGLTLEQQQQRYQLMSGNSGDPRAQQATVAYMHHQQQQQQQQQGFVPSQGIIGDMLSRHTTPAGQARGLPGQPLSHPTGGPMMPSGHRLELRGMPFAPHMFRSLTSGNRPSQLMGNATGPMHQVEMQQQAQQHAMMGLGGVFTSVGVGGLGGPNQTKLLQDQPLLLEDLLEQEKQEQRRQALHQATIQQQQQQQSMSGPGSVSQTVPVPPTTTASDSSITLTDADFDKLGLDVLAEGFHRQLPLGEAFPGAPLNNLPQQQQQMQQQPAMQQQAIEHTLQHSMSNMPWPPGRGDAAGTMLTQHGFAPRHVMQDFRPFLPPGGVPPGQPCGSYGGVPMLAGGPSVGMMPGMTPVGFQPSQPQMPPKPPEPQGDGYDDPATKQRYIEWLQQCDAWLSEQIHSLEAQVAKFRKTKKALNAKQRVARKNGNELSETDSTNLTSTTQEQSNLQKQLDQLRKQHRTHKTVIQEFRNKQPDGHLEGWPNQNDAPALAGLHAPGSGDGSQQQLLPLPQASQAPAGGAVTTPVKAATVMSAPRMPGAAQQARLPPSARQEYDAYMQNRLRMQQQQLQQQQQQQQQQLQGTLTRATMVVQGDENNPFSESYQQREYIEKLRQQEQQQLQQRHAEHQQHMPHMDQQGQFPVNQRLPYMQFGPDGSSQFVTPRFPVGSADQQAAGADLRCAGPRFPMPPGQAFIPPFVGPGGDQRMYGPAPPGSVPVQDGSSTGSGLAAAGSVHVPPFSVASVALPYDAFSQQSTTIKQEQQQPQHQAAHHKGAAGSASAALQQMQQASSTTQQQSGPLSVGAPSAVSGGSSPHLDPSTPSPSLSGSGRVNANVDHDQSNARHPLMWDQSNSRTHHAPPAFNQPSLSDPPASQGDVPLLPPPPPPPAVSDNTVGGGSALADPATAQPDDGTKPKKKRKRRKKAEIEAAAAAAAATGVAASTQGLSTGGADMAETNDQRPFVTPQEEARGHGASLAGGVGGSGEMTGAHSSMPPPARAIRHPGDLQTRMQRFPVPMMGAGGQMGSNGQQLLMPPGSQMGHGIPGIVGSGDSMGEQMPRGPIGPRLMEMQQQARMMLHHGGVAVSPQDNLGGLGSGSGAPTRGMSDLQKLVGQGHPHAFDTQYHSAGGAQEVLRSSEQATLSGTSVQIMQPQQSQYGGSQPYGTAGNISSPHGAPGGHQGRGGVELGEPRTRESSSTEQSEFNRSEDIDDGQARGNQLLKKLLNIKQQQLQHQMEMNKAAAAANAQANGAAMSHQYSSRLMNEDEENIELTPEQQRQLALIESMPLTIETDIDIDAGTEQKSSEERDRIIEQRRLEFERRRKELADQQPKLPKPRQRKSPKQSSGPGAAATTMIPIESGPVGPSAPPAPLGEQKVGKKRQKKALFGATWTGTGVGAAMGGPLDVTSIGPTQQLPSPAMAASTVSSKPAERGIDYSFITDQLFEQLQQLVAISLQEPEVKVNYAVWPMLGTSVFSDGNCGTSTELSGRYGNALLNDLNDYYNMSPFISTATGTMSGPGNATKLSPPKLAGVRSPRTPSIDINTGTSGGGGGHITPDSGAVNKQSVSAGLESSDARSHAVSSVRFPVSSSSSSLNLVNSILSDQQSRGAVTDRVRLPTPPLIEPRYDALCRSIDQSPLTVVSSSSPELGLDDSNTMDWLDPAALYPGFKLIRHEQFIKREEGCASPEIQIACPHPLKAAAAQPRNIDFKPIASEKVMEAESRNCGGIGRGTDTNDIKGFPTFNLSQRPIPESNQVSVMLTLSSSAADNIGGVIAAIADLLRIAVPPSYEISRSPSPETQRRMMSVGAGAYSSVGVKHKEEAVNIQALMMSRNKYCQNCDVIVVGNAGIRRKRSEMLHLNDDLFNELDDFAFTNDELLFCGESCYAQYDIARHQRSLSKKTTPTTIPARTAAAEPDSLPTNDLQDTFSGPVETITKVSSAGSACAVIGDALSEKPLSVLSVDVVPKTEENEGCHTPVTPTKGSGIISMASTTPGKIFTKKADGSSGKQKHRASTALDNEQCKIQAKKLREAYVRRWTPLLVKTEKIIKAATEKELSEMMDRTSAIIRAKLRTPDERKCVLCHELGDAITAGPGRLLEMDIDMWVHLNCALWSYEVYETMNGALVNVDQAVRRTAMLDCVLCHRPGATVACFKKPRCTNVYHVACAQKDGASFFQDKTVLCSLHCAPKLDQDMILTSLSVFRRVYINRDESRQVARAIMHHDDKKNAVRIGGLTLHSIGQLLAHQIHSGLFNTTDYIYPVGFKATRYYWSYRQINKRCRYVCKIEERDGRPEFVLTVLERGKEQIIHRDTSCRDLWNRVLEPLEKMRRENDFVKIFPTYLIGEELFGLGEATILKIIESLPGIEMVPNYRFRYGRSAIYKLPLAVNPSGCVRTEQKMRIHFKKPHALHSGSISRTLPSTVTVMPGDINSPYLKQFVHSKSAQYRRLKSEWRNNVFLRRSNVQGLGLFAARELEKHTMVIEYIGEMIRSEVAEKREKLYEKSNHGVYMFRINDGTVVDATMSGGPARYVNHSCNPNCVAEVVPFERDSKIIIITKRKIAQGEELSYDYKFDYEDDQHKIPCLCGAPNCRKWMN